jgi:DNA helicase II / ATP-dependent DNA helicase PcrA
MLLTFSRRAAVEMQRRVERITSEVLGPNARALGAGMSWSGTFHAMGARLLREYAPQIGLNKEFTIHDREDSADLMNLVRHDLGLAHNPEAFQVHHFLSLHVGLRTIRA